MNAIMTRADEQAFSRHLATNRYFDRSFDVEAIKILPGEYFVTEGNEVLVTVLGSCVSACIRDARRGMGGMNHFMLPSRGPSAPVVSASARYGAFAMETLINHLLKLGARREDLEAKVFGGARVLASLTASDVGERNAEFVCNYLARENIPVIAEDLYDVYPRKLYFFPPSGRVLMKKLVTRDNRTVLDRERDYAEQLRDEPVAGDVELFG
ncbi:MAG: chemoreceptor glutamine deamidase CheD [Rhodocyclaceae bacterium]|nr:chemoreceptor glutamine deamidase CheD [Rhodocyclaceae bacterium]